MLIQIKNTVFIPLAKLEHRSREQRELAQVDVERDKRQRNRARVEMKENDACTTIALQLHKCGQYTYEQTLLSKVSIYHCTIHVNSRIDYRSSFLSRNFLFS